MKKKYLVHLTEEEKKVCESILSKGKTNAQRLKRAYALLGVNEGVGGKKQKDSEVAKAYGLTSRMLENLRKRFVEEGFDVALNGRKRKRRKDLKIDGEVEAHIIAISRSKAPKGRVRWTLELIAKKVIKDGIVESISLTMVSRILKKAKSSCGEMKVG